MKRRFSGFSGIEVVAVLAAAGAIFGMFMGLRENLLAMDRDEERKAAINAIEFSLEDFYGRKGYYPEVISFEVLPISGEGVWTDPEGVAFGDYASDYHYLPADCFNERCQGYEVRSKMEKEDTYRKANYRF